MIPNDTSTPAADNLFNLFASKKLCIKCSNVVYNYQLPNSFQVEEIKERIGNFTKLLHNLKILFTKISIFECVEKIYTYCPIYNDACQLCLACTKYV